MTLRPRLALTLVLTAIPLLLSFAWARRELNRRSDVQALRDFVLDRLSSLGRERCEAASEDLLPSPGHPPGPPLNDGPPPLRPRVERAPQNRPPPHSGPSGPRRAPVRAYAYDDAFRAASSGAPPFPPPLQRALERGGESASRWVSAASGEEEVELALRTGWNEGLCAVVLARWPGRGYRAEPLAFFTTALPLLGVALTCVLLAAGPMVRRIRALTSAVGRAADTQYAVTVPVEGRDEITELARAFNDAGARLRDKLAALEQRDRTLRAFLANTTHDVMIPLTVLLGHLSDLRGRLAQSAGEDAGLVAAMQEAQYLASLLHNLGAAAKLESGEPLVEFHPVDLGEVVERVVARHRPVAGPAGVAIEFGVPERPVIVEGDVTLIEQAVSNLVHNAVRYNRRDGHVAVILEESDPAGFRLRVLDDGPGVKEEDLALLLERRQRGDEARQRQVGGLGLGLHIARTVAERHGFELHLGRSEHGGLEATISGRVRAPVPGGRDLPLKT